MNKKNTYIMLSDGKFLESEICYEEAKDIIKPQSKVVCIPFACDMNFLFKECNKSLSYNGEFYNQHYNHFIEYGVNKDNFYVVNPSDNIEFIKWKIEHCDIIYLSGGSMKNLKFMLQAFGLWDILRKIEDKVIIGESAGTLMLQRCYIVFTEEGMPQYYKGLSLVNTDLFVHYDKGNEIHSTNFNTMRIFNKAYAITDEGGLIIKGNDILKVGIVYD